MTPPWDAAAYFQALGDHAVAGNVEAILVCADTSVAIYTAEQTYVFHDRAQMRVGLTAYCRFLQACGVTSCFVETAELTDRRGAEASVDVRASYRNAEGREVGLSHTYYYLSKLETAAKVSIMDIKSLPIPFSSLPFNLSDFE